MKKDTEINTLFLFTNSVLVPKRRLGTRKNTFIQPYLAHQTLDERVKAFLQFKELLGNALLFFLHEQLRKEPRFENTLAALQRDGLIIEVREIKNIVQSTEKQLNQAITKKQFGEVAKLG